MSDSIAEYNESVATYEAKKLECNKLSDLPFLSYNFISLWL